MKKTTTNINLSTVMHTAHTIRNDAAARYNCKPSAIHWGMCLKAAWAIVRHGSMGAAIRAEYDSYDVAALDRWVRNACHKYAKIEIGRSMGNDSYNRRLEQPAFDWYGFAENHLDDMAQGAWCYLLQRIDDAAALETFAAKGKGLRHLVYNAARSGVTKVLRAESKHAHVSAWSSDGETNLLEVLCSDSVTCDLSSIAHDADLSAVVVDFAGTLDARNREIFALRLDGKTLREIAAILGDISNVAVHKRLTKIKAALEEYMAG